MTGIFLNGCAMLIHAEKLKLDSLDLLLLYQFVEQYGK